MKKKTWKIESIGIDIVPPEQRTGRPLQLFWIWSAANIGILGIVYGAIIVSFGLSFIQSILATIIGIASFTLVGLTSFAGHKGHTTTLTLSRAIFGFRGNILPTIFSWINLMGWESVNMITGTMTLAALFQAIGFELSYLTTAISLIIFGGLTIIVSMLGQNMVMWLQSWCTKIFGTLTFIVIIYIMFNTNWIDVFNMPDGDWLTGFLPAISIIAAGTGISWAIAGADYSRYQAESSSKRNIFVSVLGGACLPLFLLLFVGILLSAQLPDLASSANPIALIGSALPAWMSIPYLFTATAGIVTIAVLSLYSASLNLLTIGVKVKQIVAVTFDSILVLAIAIYVLFLSGDFLDPFISFLVFCGVFLASWEAIFILDYFVLRQKSGYNIDDLYGNNQKSVNFSAIICWIFGSLCGLLVTKTGFIDGPLAKGIFEESSLGLFISFIVSFICYFMVIKMRRAK